MIFKGNLLPSEHLAPGNVLVPGFLRPSLRVLRVQFIQFGHELVHSPSILSILRRRAIDGRWQY